MRSLIDTIVLRDNLTYAEAQEQIDEAKAALLEYIENGDFESAEDVCQEFFGLEPDYLTDLM